MRPADDTNESIKRLHLKASADLDKRVHDEISRALAESQKHALSEVEGTKPANSQPDVWRTIMKTRTVRFAAAAVIALAVVGGMTFWPGHSSDSERWWLGSPAAWGQEILGTLDTVKAVTCREQHVTVFPDGSKHTSMTWDIFYVSHDSYRRDTYDGDVLREIQWYVPDGDNMVQCSVRFDLESYFTQTHTGKFGIVDPVEGMRFYVGLLDEADRLLGTEVIDGCQCVGFEISTSKYEISPGQGIDRIWFDVETKLPVRIEHRGMPITGHPDETGTIIQDQFDYNPDLAADTFVPKTPEGFVFGHPDDVQIQAPKK